MNNKIDTTKDLGKETIIILERKQRGDSEFLNTVLAKRNSEYVVWTENEQTNNSMACGHYFRLDLVGAVKFFDEQE